MNHLELVVQETHVNDVYISTDIRPGSTAQRNAFLVRRLHNGIALAVGDALGVSIALLGGVWFNYSFTGASHLPGWGFYLLPACSLGAFVMHLLPSWGMGVVEETRRILLMLATVFGLAGLVLLASSGEIGISGFSLAASFLLAAILLPYVRSRVRGALSKGSEWGIHAVVYGAGSTGRKVVKQLQREPGIGYMPIAVLDDNPRVWGRTVEGVRVLGHAGNVMTRAQVAILAMPGAGSKRQVELLQGPLSCYLKVVVVPALLETQSHRFLFRDLSGIGGLEVASDLTYPSAQFVKRLGDIILLYLTLPVWLPLACIIAIAIWITDRGRPIIAQVRVGKDGKEFHTWKFRTLVPNADDVLRRTLDENEDLRREWETTYRLREDPRITGVGRLIRRYSLEHLPGIWNVLNGEMSLVGPRPLPSFHHDDLADDIRRVRDRVRPGLTGMWQVSGRYGLELDAVEQWDSYYVHNWSIFLDMVVLARALRRAITGS